MQSFHSLKLKTSALFSVKSKTCLLTCCQSFSNYPKRDRYSVSDVLSNFPFKTAFPDTLLPSLKISKADECTKFNPLSQEGEEGGVAATPPLRIFPRSTFAFLLRLPYGQFTHRSSRYTCICENIF